MSSPSGATRKAVSKRSVRQSVTIPGPLAAEVRRVARQRHLTMSKALVDLAERGVQAEREARAQLRSTYTQFLKEKNSARKDEAGKNLIRAIFGDEALAEDPIR